MKIPEKAKQRLIDQGFAVNVEFYEHNGETIQHGRVGDIMGEYAEVAHLRLKKGDSWRETLDTNNWTIKVEKI